MATATRTATWPEAGAFETRYSFYRILGDSLAVWDVTLNESVPSGS